MRLLCLIVFLLTSVFSLQVSAQSWSRKKGEKLYEAKAYAEAIPYLEHSWKRDSLNPVVLGKLAESYRLSDRVPEAAKYYGKLVYNEWAEEQQILQYCQLLMELGNYEEAKAVLVEQQAKSQNLLFALENLKMFYRDSVSYIVDKATFSTSAVDFSPVVWNDWIVFTSGKRTNYAVNSQDSWMGKSFYRLFYTYRGKKGFVKPKKFSKKSMVKFHHGPVCISPEGDMIYITTNNVVEKKVHRDSSGIIGLKIQYATLNGSKIGPLNELEFCSDDYNVAHPAISPDGKCLYFASDMPGGFGGMDIYRCDKNGESWGTPVNLGATVNTSGNELFPTIKPTGELFYSSTGLAGLGGLDLFYTKQNSEGWSIPVNLGYPMNSAADDFGMTFQADFGSGYFTSNRGGWQNDDIYAFEILRPLRQTYMVKVLDSLTRQLVPDAEISIAEEWIAPHPDSAGVFYTTLLPGKKYTVNADAETYTDFRSQITPRAGQESIDLEMTKTMQLRLSILVYNSPKDKTPVPGQKVVLTDADGNRKEFITDADGKISLIPLLQDNNYALEVPNDMNYKIWLPTDGYETSQDFNEVLYVNPAGLLVINGNVLDKTSAMAAVPYAKVQLLDVKKGTVLGETRADVKGFYRFAGVEGGKQYIVKASKPGYLMNTAKVTVKQPKNNFIIAEFSKNINIGKIEIGVPMKIENIYFDYTRWNIRQDAAEELDKLVNILQENPEIVVELSSHTDCRGTASFNMELSDKRAKSSAAYIVEKGISEARISGKGYGEEELVNDCGCEGKVEILCSEEAHQENRRTEFTVVGFLKDGKIVID